MDALLDELGNTKHAIPYFGLFRPGHDPVHFDGVYTSSNQFLDQLGADDLIIDKETEERVAEDEAAVLPGHVSQLAH